MYATVDRTFKYRLYFRFLNSMLSSCLTKIISDVNKKKGNDMKMLYF